jgi:hypothetical protein
MNLTNYSVMSGCRWALSAAALCVAAAVIGLHAQQQAADGAGVAVKVGAADIVGAVTSPNGPEAGVWVVAETNDLPTKYGKIVVTDEKGRFLIPDLPKAGYSLWVRGYGLVDSAKVKAAPGQILQLAAVPAPSTAAAAEYYPGMYWYSMMHIPAKSQFPGTGQLGNGISPMMKTQDDWIDSLKNSCQSCHAMGSKGIRSISKEWGVSDSTDAWQHRLQAGQARMNMALTLSMMGPKQALSLFADWTDRIAKGELPAAKPERPQGIERNIVLTMWEWSRPKAYLHDEISTDPRNPRVNANGLIYGSTEESTDMVPVLNPVTNTVSEIKHPFRDPDTPSSSTLTRGHSIYWGDEQIWDGHTSIHNPMIDEKGRLWFTARIRGPKNPAWCQAGSDLPSAKVVPLAESVRQLSMYDPKTKKWSLIDTCFNTQHLLFGHDANNTLWTSAGPPDSGVVGWLNTKMYLATGDEKKSQGWTPIIIDTNGNGKRDEYTEANQPFDPKKDRRVLAAFYGVQPSPVDDSVWGQSMDIGFSRLNQPSYLIHVMPGADPSQTALSEIFLAPEGGYGMRGIDIGLDGVVWTALSSGHLASFDRRKCKGPVNGPEAATGKLCQEGWTLYRFPGPQFQGLTDSGSAEHAYFVWVDRYNTLGLGANVPIAEANGGEALVALVNGKFITIHVPYPMGFFSKNVDGRIDNPNTGWKGKGLWTTLGTRTVFHNEGGTESRPKVYKIQLRPDPLAR